MRHSTSGSGRTLLIAAGMTLMVSTAHAGPALPLTGEWGGPQVRLLLTETGGKLELACAAANIDAPVRPDAAGKFIAAGSYESFTGGPTPADVPPKTTSAEFSGHVVGNTLQLSVRQRGGNTTQDFTLERGRKVKMIRCA